MYVVVKTMLFADEFILRLRTNIIGIYIILKNQSIGIAKQLTGYKQLFLAFSSFPSFFQNNHDTKIFDHTHIYTYARAHTHNPYPVLIF